LPTSLIQAFRATLEEVTEAALLVHVVDASSPHVGEQAAQVRKVLTEIEADKTPQLLVLNKVDLFQDAGLDAAALHARISGGEGAAIAVSARTGLGLDRLLSAIDQAVTSDEVSRVRFRFPAGEGSSLHLLHEFGSVIAVSYAGEYCEVEADVPQSLKRRLARYVFEG
jgi:GTPase